MLGPNFGGSNEMEDIRYTLYAVDIPQKDLAPKPPIPNAILDKFDHCYDLDHLPSDPDGLDRGGHLIPVGKWKDRLEELIDTGCSRSIDPRRFGLPDNDKKDADGHPLRIYVRARLLDPTDPDSKDPKALLSDANSCNNILKSVLNDCKYTVPFTKPPPPSLVSLFPSSTPPRRTFSIPVFNNCSVRMLLDSG